MRGLCKGGENCLKYLKRGWNRKNGRKNKGFKKGGQAGSRGGCFKKKVRGGGAGTPIMNYYDIYDIYGIGIHFELRVFDSI